MSKTITVSGVPTDIREDNIFLYRDTLAAPDPKLRERPCPACGVGANEPCWVSNSNGFMPATGRVQSNGVHMARLRR